MNAKDRVITILAAGILSILAFIVVADFAVAITEKRAPDQSVIELLKMSITGIVGILAGYLAGKSN